MKKSMKSGQKIITQTKNIFKLLIPPIFWNFARVMFGPKPSYIMTFYDLTKNIDYATIEKFSSSWNSKTIADEHETKWQSFNDILNQDAISLGFIYEKKEFTNVYDITCHNLNMTFIYCLFKAYRDNHLANEISLLDWGGGTGHHYQLAKTLIDDDLKISYSVVEVEHLSELGRRINPQICWYVDDSYMQKKFDIVFNDGALQCIYDWKALLTKLINCCSHYLFLQRVPVLKASEGYAAIQNVYNTKLLHFQINEEELLSFIRMGGFKLLRVFPTFDTPYFANAPEQPSFRGYLFTKVL
jgi:putative methyltransferase (TIGR04325 family)